MTLAAFHWLQIQFVLLLKQVLLIVTLHRQLRLERVHFDLHLRKVHVGFADLLSFLRNHSLKVALLLGELSLELRCKLSPQLFDLHALFSCELLSKYFLHLLINVMCCLSIIDDLLLLHLHMQIVVSLFKLALFGLFNDFSFQLNLFFETDDLLTQNSFPLISFKFILLTEDLAYLALFSLI